MEISNKHLQIYLKVLTTFGFSRHTLDYNLIYANILCYISLKFKYLFTLFFICFYF